MKIKPMPSQKYLRSVLDYNPDTGIFKWKVRKNKTIQVNAKYSGKVAGYENGGYWHIVIDGALYLAHRLAWVYMYGDVLTNKIIIDHRDGYGTNNIVTNLRICSSLDNGANAKLHKNKVLPKGVSRQQTYNGYLARITLNYKTFTLGTFKTPELAHEAYCKAAHILKGQFARVA